MKINKKLALTGATLSVLSVVAVAPTAKAIDLASVLPSHKQLMDKTKLVALDTQANAAVEVKTDLNCTSHVLMATVTNKTAAEITPALTFNTQKPTYPKEPTPIKAGDQSTYFWYFSGNSLLVNVTAKVDTFADVTSFSMVNCAEPVSFRTEQVSKSMVSGYLTNNSNFVGQTVYTRVNGGDIRVESLEPGETRLVAMPFNSLTPDPETAFVAIGTGSGWQGTYQVDLKAPTMGILK